MRDCSAAGGIISYWLTYFNFIPCSAKKKSTYMQNKNEQGT